MQFGFLKPLKILSNFEILRMKNERLSKVQDFFESATIRFS